MSRDEMETMVEWEDVPSRDEAVVVPAVVRVDGESGGRIVGPVPLLLVKGTFNVNEVETRVGKEAEVLGQRVGVEYEWCPLTIQYSDPSATEEGRRCRATDVGVYVPRRWSRQEMENVLSPGNLSAMVGHVEGRPDWTVREPFIVGASEETTVEITVRRGDTETTVRGRLLEWEMRPLMEKMSGGAHTDPYSRRAPGGEVSYEILMKHDESIFGEGVSGDE